MTILSNSEAPYCFLDVDGVLNHLTAYQVWVGEGRIPSWTSPEYSKRSNWEVLEYEVDNELYYAPDSEAIVEIPRRDWEGNVFEHRKVRIQWSSELMEEFRQLIARGQLDVHYLSAWRGDAVELLSPLFGLPESVSFLPWRERGMSDYNQAGKYISLEDHYTGEVPGFKPKPFIWFDDVANKHLANYPTLDPTVGKTYGLKRRTGVDCLIINTDPINGIARDHMRMLREFIAAPASFVPVEPPLVTDEDELDIDLDF